MEAYRRYGPALLRKAQRLLQSRDDAEDQVQALFVDMLSRGEKRADLPFLYRAMTNRCLNLLRDRATRERLLASCDEQLRGPARLRCDERVVGLELLAKLAQRLDALGLEILVYRFVDDLSQEEIAELVRKSRKTVGRRLQDIEVQIRALGAGTGEGLS